MFKLSFKTDQLGKEPDRIRGSAHEIARILREVASAAECGSGGVRSATLMATSSEAGQSASTKRADMKLSAPAPRPGIGRPGRPAWRHRGATDHARRHDEGAGRVGARRARHYDAGTGLGNTFSSAGQPPFVLQ
jgi:hypothetical protein